MESGAVSDSVSVGNAGESWVSTGVEVGSVVSVRVKCSSFMSKSKKGFVLQR